MTNLLPTHLDLWQSTLSWQPTIEQQRLFQALYTQILSGNQQLNLTRITEPEDFWEKHLWDSLSGLAPWLADLAAATTPEPSPNLPVNTLPVNTLPVNTETSLSFEDTESIPLRMIDIGTGGGFPGIPAAIALSPFTIDLTLVDATRKKIFFLQTLCQQLGLSADCIATRAEALGRDAHHRETYDLALIRAVGSAATCAEYVLPFLKVGGQAVIYRGQWTLEETDALIPVIELLGGELTDLQSWQTPLTHSSRHCLFIHKEQPISTDFPRAVGIPGKSPLT
ncbi:16S rRNA (guanine(527)-N(7))-methyltransferase RsmG [cf. Phormidesmis sp. LEGE 11477]|uniref:16S rRNA (guanine(527)-N(7))-methyltransferase RsmG n=1 Tax=cf. Phormidesmis sp. LEGE 11477 TaxID=1828680 RepID=UPI00187EC207|nr:16S rRNA (guanine(527)-N(7))-methyltransferase RsmG [cf. Phormidesmis sp. LEGE 11477]MBE9061304.1 16S rRNA (guanine(527)-N(7))-methyltransferase RsmG [cf. Phormidesmis sp. LEGE 11477]